MKKRISVKLNTIIILLTTFILLFILITVYGSSTGKTLVAEVSTANQNMLDLYGSQLSSLCTEINRCLATIELSDYPDNLSQEDISGQLSTYVLLYDDRFSFCFYDRASDHAIVKAASNIYADERDDILNYFRKNSENLISGRWLTPSINNKGYLMRIYHYKDAYLASWISLENALSLYKNNQFDQHAALYFSDASGRILTNSVKVSDSNQYLHLTRSIVPGELNLDLLLPYSRILSSFRFITMIQWLIIASFILSVIVLLYYFNYFVFKPIRQLYSAMNEVKSGNYNVTLPLENTSKEFYIVNEAFNEMVNEINYLKVSVYEREIFNQQLELEKMQLQVKPHFYLNCLNIIFNLAQGGDFKLIQELCMAQIRYFRYMMKSSFTTVTIKDEFAHIENYLHIQELRYPGRYNIDLNLNSEAENIQIPPLVLHVFAENVIKHVSSYGKVSFAISANVNAEGYAQIVISDDGPGFSGEVLAKLNQGELLTDENGSHIGISNTIKRLKLFYKNDCRIKFQNGPEGGAYIYITIPMSTEAGNESSDN